MNTIVVRKVDVKEALDLPIVHCMGCTEEVDLIPGQG